MILNPHVAKIKVVRKSAPEQRATRQSLEHFRKPRERNIIIRYVDKVGILLAYSVLLLVVPYSRFHFITSVQTL